MTECKSRRVFDTKTPRKKTLSKKYVSLSVKKKEKECNIFDAQTLFFLLLPPIYPHISIPGILVFLQEIVGAEDPTEHLTNLEPQNPSNDVSKLSKVRLTRDCEAAKLRNVLSGEKERGIRAGGRFLFETWEI